MPADQTSSKPDAEPGTAPSTEAEASKPRSAMPSLPARPAARPAGMPTLPTRPPRAVQPSGSTGVLPLPEHAARCCLPAAGCCTGRHAKKYCVMCLALLSVLLVCITGAPAQASSSAGPNLPPRAAKPEETREGPPAARAQTRQQGTAYSSAQASNLPNGTAVSASGNAESHNAQAGAGPQATNAGTVAAVGSPGGDRSRGETSFLRHFWMS